MIALHHQVADELSPQDALLASRVLVSLLRQEDIPYTLIPIGGYSELEARKNQIFGIDPNADEEEQVVSRDCEVCGRTMLLSQIVDPSLETGAHAHFGLSRVPATDSKLLSTRNGMPYSPD